MYLNSLKPAEGSKKTRRRVGRGRSSGAGKTSGRGQKGQKARSGGGVKAGFEGGQMPLHRRLPKYGFRSRKARTVAEITLAQLAKLDNAEVDFNLLKEANFFNHTIKDVKIIASGKIDKAITIRHLRVTKGARAAIEAAGGKIIEREQVEE